MNIHKLRGAHRFDHMVEASGKGNDWIAGEIGTNRTKISKMRQGHESPKWELLEHMLRAFIGQPYGLRRLAEARAWII